MCRQKSQSILLTNTFAVPNIDIDPIEHEHYVAHVELDFEREIEYYRQHATNNNKNQLSTNSYGISNRFTSKMRTNANRATMT
jgi:hypothetical protein